MTNTLEIPLELGGVVIGYPTEGNSLPFPELVINSSAVIRISEPLLYLCLGIDRFTLTHTPIGLILIYMPYTTVLLLTLFASRSKEE